MSFHSDGDTEVILRAYLEWGEACVERLHGMFAFAIWNRETLFLARDRLGIKPLYYSENLGCFRFASTPQALLAAGGVDTGIDAVALHHLFTLHAVVPAPRTIFNGVRKLAPGTTLTVNARGELSHKKYWSLKAQRPAGAEDRGRMDRGHPRKPAAGGEETHRDRRRQGRRAALRRARFEPAGGASGRAGRARPDDLFGRLRGPAGRARQRVRIFRPGGRDVRHAPPQVPDPQFGGAARLPEAVDAMSEPMFAQDAVAFYLLAEQVSKTVKVVQSGQGADEVFGGYFWYPRMAAETSGHPLDRFRRHYFDRDHDEFLDMAMPAYHGPDYTAEMIAAHLAEPFADEFIDQVLRMDTTMLITDDPVKRVDNMTMAWGLEARVPFLDHQLVELAASMPPELKLASEGKHVLKKIARGRVPDAVIDRKKGYFPMPALKFVRGEFLNFMQDILNSQACRERGLYHRAYVNKLLDAPEQHHTRIQGSKLWHLALLEYWLQKHA
jgi:asparagine synthase (glutamine-hydrolysing)